MSDKNNGSNAVMFLTFKLAKGASAADFLLAAEKLHAEFMSKQKGFISWKQLSDGETWADLITWETMDDAQNAAKASETTAAAGEFFSFLELESVKANFYTVEKTY